jgi:hypothetical protein
MSDKTPSRRIPGDIPEHHTRLAARLRATASVKALLLEEAKRAERMAELT